LLGLLPGAANMTGNIAVTMVLAVLTFIITNVNGNKDYWKHVFMTPGVPIPMLLIIVPVEIIGLFTKPFALMVRLFVAITAGHIVILGFIALAFIFESITIGVVSTVMVTFINIIELLVATIQAYVFTLFSAMYIGSAVAEHAHDDHH
jgi:F-type H+-transporting ATPase subunit a